MSYPVWNCHVKVENATEVGLGWGVTDDPTPDPHDYAALITLKLPQAAGVATVVSNKTWETVVLIRDPSLSCGPNGIAASVTYRVSRTTGNGSQVKVNIANNAGMKPPPTGGVLGQATGQIGDDITVPFVMQGTCD
jgi:hypothetical protein